jgi:ABC-type nitrate/sulfonate/bicarbonate transport system permease component
MASIPAPVPEASSSISDTRRRHRTHLRDIGLRLALYLSLPAFLLLWQLVSGSGNVNRILAPAPTDVIAAIGHALGQGTLVVDIGWSVSRVIVGYACGAALGIVAGLLTARFKLIDNLVSPTLQTLRPIPPIAIVPLTIIWFGLTEGAKYFLIGWGVFFVVWIATYMGVRRINPLLIRAAQSLGVPENRMLREVVLPGALPYIAVGLRTSVTIAFYSLVAAEVAGAFAGIAYRVNVSHQNMQTSLMIGSLLVLGLISAVADYAFDAVARRVVFWH